MNGFLLSLLYEIAMDTDGIPAKQSLFPVFLIQTVLNGDDRILVSERLDGFFQNILTCKHICDII